MKLEELYCLVKEVTTVYQLSIFVLRYTKDKKYIVRVYPDGRLAYWEVGIKSGIYPDGGARFDTIQALFEKRREIADSDDWKVARASLDVAMDYLNQFVDILERLIPLGEGKTKR